MIKLFARFGCYMQMEGMLFEVTNRDHVTQQELDDLNCQLVYPLAYELGEGWVGSHGFCEDDEGEALEDYHDELEGHLEYSLEVYDPEEHDGYQCGQGFDVEQVELRD